MTAEAWHIDQLAHLVDVYVADDLGQALLLFHVDHLRPRPGRRRGQSWYRDRTDALVKIGQAARAVALDSRRPKITKPEVAKRLGVSLSTLERALHDAQISWPAVLLDAVDARQT